MVKNKKEVEFKNNLVKLLKNEQNFKIQIFSFEPIEVFEKFLNLKKINYKKGFTSENIKNNLNSIVLLLNDDEQKNITFKKVILYSNIRNYSFIPYFFDSINDFNNNFNSDNKNISNSDNINNSISISKSNSISNKSSIIRRKNNVIDIVKFSSKSFNYIRSVIILAMIKEKKLKNISKEIKLIDPNLSNIFVIKSELNWLCKYKFCIKSSDVYKLNISQDLVIEICKNLGFNDIYK